MHFSARPGTRVGHWQSTPQSTRASRSTQLVLGRTMRTELRWKVGRGLTGTSPACGCPPRVLPQRTRRSPLPYTDFPIDCTSSQRRAVRTVRVYMHRVSLPVTARSHSAFTLDSREASCLAQRYDIVRRRCLAIAHFVNITSGRAILSPTWGHDPELRRGFVPCACAPLRSLRRRPPLYTVHRTAMDTSGAAAASTRRVHSTLSPNSK